jgi:hypothetical protein
VLQRPLGSFRITLSSSEGWKEDEAEDGREEEVEVIGMKTFLWMVLGEGGRGEGAKEEGAS